MHANDTLIERVTGGSGHGFSIGSIATGYIRNITVRNVTVSGAQQAFRIKTDQGGSGYVTDVSYSDAEVSNTGSTIVVTMYYATSPNPTTMAISNVTFANIIATDSGAAGGFDCVPESPCRDMTLSNVQHVGTAPKGWACSNAFGSATDTSPDASGCLKS